MASAMGTPTENDIVVAAARSPLKGAVKPRTKTTNGHGSGKASQRD